MQLQPNPFKYQGCETEIITKKNGYWSKNGIQPEQNELYNLLVENEDIDRDESCIVRSMDS